MRGVSGNCAAPALAGISMSSSESIFTRLADRLEKGLTALGQAVSWLGVVLIFSIILQVVLRYGFGHGLIVLEELQWHLYGIGILLGLSYTTIHDGHVRVDLFHEHFSERLRAWIELLGTLILLWPFIYVVFMHSLPFLAESYALGETSDAPAGLPFRWIIKGFIPVGMVLLFLASLVQALRCVHIIILKPRQ